MKQSQLRRPGYKETLMQINNVQAQYHEVFTTAHLLLILSAKFCSMAIISLALLKKDFWLKFSTSIGASKILFADASRTDKSVVNLNFFDPNIRSVSRISLPLLPKYRLFSAHKSVKISYPCFRKNCKISAALTVSLPAVSTGVKQIMV